MIELPAARLADVIRGGQAARTRRRQDGGRVGRGDHGHGREVPGS